MLTKDDLAKALKDLKAELTEEMKREVRDAWGVLLRQALENHDALASVLLHTICRH